jgi:glutathione S-transferase
MMMLRSSPASPFGRKVRIAAGVLGLSGQIDVRETDLNDPADSIRAQNPLGKIPALVLDNGDTLFDSRVIVDYLDHVAGGGRIVPREGDARFKALRMQALCDGILDASLMIVYESRYRPAEHRVESWVERQAGKAARGLAALEAAPPKLGNPPDIGQIALACVLGYGDLRFEGKWRKDHPRLVAFHDAFAAQVPAFAETKVTP